MIILFQTYTATLRTIPCCHAIIEIIFNTAPYFTPMSSIFAIDSTPVCCRVIIATHTLTIIPSCKLFIAISITLFCFIFFNKQHKIINWTKNKKNFRKLMLCINNYYMNSPKDIVPMYDISSNLVEICLIDSNTIL